MTTDERAALVACRDALREHEDTQCRACHGHFIGRVALTRADAVLAQPAQPAPTAEAVPWTGPVRVELDAGGTDAMGDPYPALWIVKSDDEQTLYMDSRRQYADAIAAALNAFYHHG